MEVLVIMKKFLSFMVSCIVICLSLLFLLSCNSDTEATTDSFLNRTSDNSEIDNSSAETQADLQQLQDDHEHSYGGWTTIKVANCTEDGIKERVCRCGDVQTETIHAKGHTAIVDVAIEATCTQDGKTEGAHCSECGAILIKQQIIPAKGHNRVVDEAVPATCTQSGLTEGSHCSECGAILQTQDEVAPSHNDQYGICTICYEVTNSDLAVNHYVNYSSNAYSQNYTCYYDYDLLVRYSFSTEFLNFSYVQTYNGKLMLNIDVSYVACIEDYSSQFRGTGFVKYAIYYNGSYIDDGTASISGYGGALANIHNYVLIDEPEMANITIRFSNCYI